MSERPEWKFTYDGYDVTFKDAFSNMQLGTYMDKYESREGADFTLVVDGEEIPCHQELLAYHSPVFKVMLSQDLSESRQRMSVYNMSKAILESLLQYMYTAQLHVSKRNMLELIVATDYLQMQYLHDKLTYHTASRDCLMFQTEKLFKWREAAERLDLGDIAMEVKKKIVEKYWRLRIMDCFLEHDFIEIGRLVKEISQDRISKDVQVDAVLHWINHHTNDDPLEWLKDEDLRDFLELVVDQWVVAPKESEVLKAREYNTLADREGSWLHNSMMIYKTLQLSALEQMEDQVEKARIKAELAELRAEQLRRQPPRIVPKYPTSHVYETFKKLYMKHLQASDPKTSDPQETSDPKTGDPKTSGLKTSEAQQTDDPKASDHQQPNDPQEACYDADADSEEEIDDKEELIEEAYETFAGNKRMRQAVGLELLKLIKVVKCSIPFLKEVISVHNGGSTTSLPFTEHIVNAPDTIMAVLAAALIEAEEKGIWLPSPNRMPMCMAIVGGRMNVDARDWNDYRDVYITYDCKTINNLTQIPSKIHPMNSSFCEVPMGYMVTGGIRSKHCVVYDTMGRQYILHCPIPVRKDLHTMAFANNRAYIVGGFYIKKWQPTVEYYDHNDRRWHHGPETPEGYADPHATGMGQDLYVMHSYSRLSHLDEVGFQWDERAPMPEVAPDARIANDGVRIYVAGGGARKLLAYTPHTNQWEILHRPLLEHIHGAVCYHNDRLYLLGGVESKVVEEYDVGDDAWTISELQLPHVLNHHYALRVEAEVPREDEITKDGYPFRHFSWRDEEQARWKQEQEEKKKKKEEEEQKKAEEEQKRAEEETRKKQGGGQEEGNTESMETDKSSEDTANEAVSVKSA